MRMVMFLAVIAAFLTVTSARAEDAENPRGARKAEMLKKFDKDNSGDLNDEEKAAAREAFAAQRKEGGERRPARERINREEVIKKYDANENGQLDPEEKEKAISDFRAKRAAGGGQPALDREKVIAEFDADKDGKLSDDEKAAARAAMKERFQKRRAEGGEKGQERPRRRQPKPE